jgi:tRNA pseudouridine55 synthase
LLDHEKKSGIFLIYKPKGISSFDVIRKAKKLLNTRKIGHAGTLDPLAEGLMVLGVNAGTKALSALLLERKSYRAGIFFGACSTTGDEEGEKTFFHEKKFSHEELEKVLPKFLGKIKQVPPSYSAIKIKGKRACDRMRKGEEVLLPKRTVEIFSLQLLSFEYPKIELYVECGSGTYIRSLVQDIGEVMKTGAYLQHLSRESLGNFALNEALSIEEISFQKIIPITPKIFSLPFVEVDQEQKKFLFWGQKIYFPHENTEKCAIFFENKWIGFGKVEDKILSTICLIGQES